MQSYWIYILASKPRGTLYIGVTNGLPARVGQHRAEIAARFKPRARNAGFMPTQDGNGTTGSHHSRRITCADKPTMRSHIT